MLRITKFLSVLLCLLFTTATLAGKSYSDIYIFGDSLSDTGNAGAAVPDLLPNPPYDNNRVSNGDVAVQALADKLDLSADPSLHVLGIITEGTNYSVAGARARDIADPQPGDTDLNDQLEAFFAKLTILGLPFPEDALFVIFIGGNDVRDARGEFSPINSQAILNNAVDGIKTALLQLTAAGAKHIMVVNAPDIGAIPETRLGAEELGIPWLINLATLKSQIFNLKLSFAVRSIEYQTGVNITQFNLFNTFSSIIDNPDKYSLVNVTDPCYVPNPEYDPIESPYFYVPIPACVGENGEAQPNTFFFIDYIHPTATVHQLTGEAMYKTLNRSRKFQRVKQ